MEYNPIIEGKNEQEILELNTKNYEKFIKKAAKIVSKL